MNGPEKGAPLDLDAIEARWKATTPGTWRWFGNTKMHDLYLATVERGREIVMSFERWGMGSGVPQFQRDGLMVRADELVTYEVPYRKDIDGIDHPDAIFLAAAHQDIPALLARVRDLKAREAEMVARVERIASVNTHLVGCANTYAYPCDCGMDALRAAVAKAGS